MITYSSTWVHFYQHEPEDPATEFRHCPSCNQTYEIVKGFIKREKCFNCTRGNVKPVRYTFNNELAKA